MQGERDEYLKQELASTKEAAENLAKRKAKAEKDAEDKAASCAAAMAAVNDIAASKASIEQQCRDKATTHAEAKSHHNTLLDKYGPCCTCCAVSQAPLQRPLLCASLGPIKCLHCSPRFPSGSWEL